MFERTRIAEALRSAREKQGLSLEEAATAAGIPLQYLRLLEGESNVRVGVSDELYLVPFFRKYARFVDIDAEEMLAEFLGIVQHLSGEGSPPVRLVYHSRWAVFWKPIAVLLTIGVAVLLMLRQGPKRAPFENQPSGSKGDDESSTPGQMLGTRTYSSPVISSPASRDLTAPTPGSVVATNTAARVDAIPEPALTAELALAAAAGHELKILAVGESWLSLSLDDQPAKQYLLRAGESRSWNAIDHFTLTVGNAGGIALSLNGRELPVIGRQGQVVRNLRLPEATPSSAAQ